MEAVEARFDLLDLRAEPLDCLLPRSSMILVSPQDDECLLGGGSSSAILGTSTTGLPDSALDSRGILIYNSFAGAAYD